MTTWNLDLSNASNFTQQDSNTVIANSTIQLSKASSLANWGMAQTYTTSGQVQSPYGVAYGNGRCVVNSGNIVHYSSDCNIWSTTTITGGYANCALAFGNNTFVSVAYNSTQASTSTDGSAWTMRTSLPSTAGWKNIIYANGQFLAIALNSNKAATSPDGITWTPRTLPSTAYWTGLAYGAGLYVTTATQASVYTYATSPDGITWTPRSMPTLTTNSFWRNLLYGNGVFMATGYNYGANKSVFSTSTDGITWSTPVEIVPSVTIAGDVYGSMMYGNGKFVLLGGSTAYNNTHMISVSTSDNGATWSAPNLIPTTIGMNQPYGAYNSDLDMFFITPMNFYPAKSLAYSYSTSPSYVTTAAASDFTSTSGNKIDSVSIAETKPTNTTIKTLVSFDNRATWKYWSGSAWVTTTLANIETNGITVTAMNAALTGYVFSGGDSALDIAFSLKTTDISLTPVVSGMSLTYSSANRPPVAPSIADVTKYNINTVVQLPAFTDPDGNPLTYSVSGLPTGLTFDATTRRIRGIAATTGENAVTMTANDGQGGVTNQGFLLTLIPVEPNTIMIDYFDSI